MAVRMSCPNDPGRVNFGRVDLAEPECHGRVNCRIRRVMAESSWKGRIRVVWPNELGRLLEYLGRVTFCRLLERLGRVT